MDNLNLIKRIIKILNNYLLTSILIFWISCTNEENANLSYLGKQSTSREYETTTWRFEAGTNIPLIIVPDSIYKRLSLDSTLISEGVISKSYITETLIPYDTSRHYISDPNLFLEALLKEEIGEKYDLMKELECISNNEIYSNTDIGETTVIIWHENEQELINSIYDSIKIILHKPISVGDEWIRESYQYFADNDNLQLFRQECRVISQESVKVKAGSFLAYKIEILNHWVDLDYKSIWSYEYYVPNVGLILEESDVNLYETIVFPGGYGETTSFFRQRQRKELIDYNFIE
jgi:hypothetical protein